MANDSFVIHGNTDPSTKYWNNDSSPAINQKNLNQIEDAIYRIFGQINTLDELKASVEQLKKLQEPIEKVLDYQKPYISGSTGDKNLSELQDGIYRVIMQRLGYLLKDITPVYDDSDVLQSVGINIAGVSDKIATENFVLSNNAPKFNKYTKGSMDLGTSDTTDCFIAIVHNVNENKIDDLTVACETTSGSFTLNNSDFGMFDDDYADYINIGYQRMRTDGTGSNIALVTVSLYDEGGYNFRQVKKIIDGKDGMDAIKKIELSGVEDMEYDIMAYTPGVPSPGITYEAFEAQAISCM